MALTEPDRGQPKYASCIHNGEKPFPSGICGKSFFQKESLKSHQRIHSGEKPFTCDTCGQSFTQKSNLSIHQIIQTAEKPFSCGICEKCFSRKGNLNEHQRSLTAFVWHKSQCGKILKYSHSLKWNCSVNHWVSEVRHSFVETAMVDSQWLILMRETSICSIETPVTNSFIKMRIRLNIKPVFCYHKSTGSHSFVVPLHPMLSYVPLFDHF